MRFRRAKGHPVQRVGAHNETIGAQERTLSQQLQRRS
jgi:hypothetical protein